MPVGWLVSSPAWHSGCMSFEVIAIVIVVWVTLSVVVALVVGAVIRQRDRHEAPRKRHVASESETDKREV